jgi:hypothetical protein
MKDIMGKIEIFAKLVEAQQIDRYKGEFENHDEALIKQCCSTKVVFGPKYTKVNVGGSGKYMVVNETGEIFGIKGYGVIHRGHSYGTVETINEWFWGGYKALKYPAKPIKLTIGEIFETEDGPNGDGRTNR